MSAPHIILDPLPSLCQKLSELVKIWRSYNKNNFAWVFLRHGVYSAKVETNQRRWDESLGSGKGGLKQMRF